jgi:hypothetical protein
MKAGYSDETVAFPRYDPAGVRVGELKARVLRRQQITRGQTDFFSVGQEGINLLKIHGSLDEFAFNDGQDLLKLMPIENSVRGVISTLQLANEQLRYVNPLFPGGYIVAANEIICEDVDGEMQFLRRTPLAGAFKFQKQSIQTVPNELLERFETYLKYVTRLVCIGYGFRDHHVNQAIRNWLELTDDHHLTIVDRWSQNIPDVLLHIYPQVNLVRADATGYLDDIGGIERSRREEAERHFGSWLRHHPDSWGLQAQEFFDSLTDDITKQSAEWLKTLPLRDGKIDLETMGMTMEEFILLGREKVHIPSVEEVLEELVRKAAE